MAQGKPKVHLSCPNLFKRLSASGYFISVRLIVALSSCNVNGYQDRARSMSQKVEGEKQFTISYRLWINLQAGKHFLDFT
jgi:hypothetical protein